MVTIAWLKKEKKKKIYDDKVKYGHGGAPSIFLVINSPLDI